MINLVQKDLIADEKMDITNADLFKTLFNLQSVSTFRSKTRFSLVFITFHTMSDWGEAANEDNESIAYSRMNDFLSSKVRDSDFVFMSRSRKYFIILLSFSGETEAKHFLDRIFQEVEGFCQEQEDLRKTYLSASIVEIANNQAGLQDVLKEGEEALQQAIQLGPFQYEVIHSFKEREIERIKVSIIEKDEIIQSIIQNILIKSKINHFDLEIQLFQDGYQFLESSWYQSGHTHIVIMNDILPKKNGIAILHELRRLPNNQKYIILMMSKRTNEEDIIYAYESGVDAYITMPFNIKLVEAQIKSLLKRLRL